MSKQDRQGSRTVEDLERRHNFEQRFSEIMGVANDARTYAEQANETASKPATNLTPEEVFNLLTDGGTVQGLYRGEDGQLYFNASYIASGIIDAAVVQVINMIANTVVSQSVEDEAENLSIGSAGLTLENGQGRAFNLRQIKGNDNSYIPFAEFINLVAGQSYFQTGRYGATGFFVGGNQNEPAMKLTAERTQGSTHGNVKLSLPVYDAAQTLDLNVYWKHNGDGTYTLFGARG